MGDPAFLPASLELLLLLPILHEDYLPEDKAFAGNLCPNAFPEL